MTSDPGMPDPAVGARGDVGLDSWALRGAFRVYKTVLSPMAHVISPTQCLYLPTCSEYAYVALARFGVARGSWLALRRLARCHPFAKGGLDPVPERKTPLQRGIHGDHLS
jgi:putative membrane protein insertion efficiency factor